MTTSVKHTEQEPQVLPSGWELSDLAGDLWEKYYSPEGKAMGRADRIKLRLDYNRAAEKYNQEVGWKCFLIIP